MMAPFDPAAHAAKMTARLSAGHEDQPRHPAGSSDGGKWRGDGASGGTEYRGVSERFWGDFDRLYEAWGEDEDYTEEKAAEREEIYTRFRNRDGSQGGGSIGDAVDGLKSDIKRLSRERTAVRKPVQRELRELKNLREGGRDEGFYPGARERRLAKITALEKAVAEKAPDLRDMEERITKRKWLVDHIERRYGGWSDRKQHDERKAAADARRRDPEIRGRVTSAAREYIEARKRFAEAYRELEGRNPEDYNFPQDEDALGRLLGDD